MTPARREALLRMAGVDGFNKPLFDELNIVIGEDQVLSIGSVDSLIATFCHPNRGKFDYLNVLPQGNVT